MPDFDSLLQRSRLLKETQRRRVLESELSLQQPSDFDDLPEEEKEFEGAHDDEDVGSDQEDEDEDEDEGEGEDEGMVVPSGPQTRSKTTAYGKLPNEKEKLISMLREMEPSTGRRRSFSACSVRELKNLILDHHGASELHAAMNAGAGTVESDEDEDEEGLLSGSAAGSAALSASPPRRGRRTAKQLRQRDRLLRILSYSQETVDTDLALVDTTLTTKLRALCRIVNGFIQKQNRERAGEGAHRFMEQGYLDLDLDAPEMTLSRSQTRLEGLLRKKIGHVFTIKGDNNQWRLRTNEGDCERAFNFSSSDEDFRVFYYDFDRWDLSDPGDGEHIQFSFWSGIADRVTWSHDPEPVDDLI